MQVLRRQLPTPEQINIVQRIQNGVSLIRGAAGSGKTSTALTALRATTGATVNQLRNVGALPANVLVLTYYNTLKGYISAVAEEELADYADSVRLFVMTFDKWAFATLGLNEAIPVLAIENDLRMRSMALPRATNFLVDESNYVMGRFLPADLDNYITAQRTGRGGSPQMGAPMRQRLLDEVVKPHMMWKQQSGRRSFHDVALAMIDAVPEVRYDVIIVDEAQDLSANQLRAVMRHAAEDAIITIVTDSAQRIYPLGAPWAEAGLHVTPNRSFRLTRNYRNTRQVAALAASLAQGIPMDDDGSIPDPARCSRDGPVPVLLHGKFSRQLNFVMDRLQQIDTENETVGFLHLKGGGWFDDIRAALDMAGLDYCELQGAAVWPEDGSNIGLCTFHSAKGLEFDHVFVIGLAQSQASYGDQPDDDRYNALRRLLAMGVGRARQTVTLGAKPGEALEVLSIIDPGTIQEIVL